MFRFELVTLNGTKFGDDVYEVVLPTPQGYIGIFPNHMPLVSLASPGTISIRKKPNTPDDQVEYFATNGGVIEIADNAVRILVDEADHADEIDEREIQKALDMAHQLRRQAKDAVQLQEAQSLIDRHTVRLKVTELRRHRKARYK